MSTQTAALRPDPYRIGGRNLRPWFLYLPRLVLAALALLLLSATASAVPAAHPEGVPGKVGSGEMLLVDATTGRSTPALAHGSKVHFTISGMVATVTLEQRFRNDSGDWVEGIYAFPLPETAAVRYMEMRMGERRVVGRIREKAEAKRVYEQAKRAGKKAGLVEQQRPNLFSNRVANIGPGEEILVRLEYVQAVDYLAGNFSLRFPMTMTPRYIPGAPLGAADPEEVELQVNPLLGWAVPTDQVPDADAITPLLNPRPGSDTDPVNGIEITAQLDMGMPLSRVESAYHDISLSRSKGVYSIQLVRGVSEMDRDFVLTWEPVTGQQPQAAVFTEEVDGEHYALLMVVPPAAAAGNADLPREIIFVVDTSGSMGGVSIEQAREALDLALRQLRPGDTFNIIAFNSSYRALYPTAMPADPRQIANASRFVRSLQAGGGTEMQAALRAALAPSGGEDGESGGRLRQVIFITDGAVGNEEALFREIAQRLGDSRLFTVGIGSAPNSWFMREAARQGRGTHTHIGDVGEVATRMGALFEQISAPLARDIRVQWPGVDPVETWPQRAPDLYRGEPLLLAARLGAQGAQGELSVSGQTADRTWSRQLALVTDRASRGHPGIASLWARRKIAGLLQDRARGVPETEVREAVLPVALGHQLLSPYTSFVAVEERVSRPPSAPVLAQPVPNTRPRGQSPQGFAYPRTATTGPARVWFGGMCLFLALMGYMLRRPEEERNTNARD